MKILFVVSDIFFGEPIGILQLSAILKKYGHQTRLVALRKHPFEYVLKAFDPDVIAYSVMSPEVALFKSADRIVQKWASCHTRKVLRIMGGPHPTYFPEILQELSLDVICIGEGDNAIIEVVRRFEKQEHLSGIPNILTSDESLESMKKELVADLDQLPFIDKSIYFEAMPAYRTLALRSIMTARGCPYDCTYCHNHAFRELFRGCGKLLRRRSVGHVIEELKYIIKEYPPVKLIKISDDTFAYKVDEWLLEFVERYKKEINLPFYCLMRSNTLTEEMARLLSAAGCHSVGMSVEAGDEHVRNIILKRGLSDTVVKNSFAYAKKYGIKTYGNTILAIPGTNYNDDFNSFLFTKKLGMTVPTFSIFNPYPKTALTEYAKEIKVLDPGYGLDHQFGFLSPLNCYTDKEKKRQLALAYLGPLFCDLSDMCIPVLNVFLRVNALKFYKYLGTAYMVLKTGLFIFPGIYPLNPIRLFKLLAQSIRFFVPGKTFAMVKGAAKNN